MNDLVITDGNKVFTTTLIIAGGVGIKHKNIMELLRKHSNTKTLSTFKTETFLVRGQPAKYAELTELQATFLITLMRNSEKVIQFKEKLATEFFKQRRIISNLQAQQQNQQWIETRKQGKIDRRLETDVIKEFIEYAKTQGGSPKGCDNYYTNLSRMENKALFILEQKYKNLRNILGITELLTVQQADMIVSKALKDGMTDKLHYKEIYRLAKNRVEMFADIRGKSSLEYLHIPTDDKPTSLTQH